MDLLAIYGVTSLLIFAFFTNPDRIFDLKIKYFNKLVFYTYNSEDNSPGMPKT